MSIYDDEDLDFDEDVEVEDEDDQWHRDHLIRATDESEVARMIARLPTATMRTLLADTARLRELLGDSQPMVADLGREIQASILTLAMELRHDLPGMVVAALGFMDADRRMKVLGDLRGRLDELERAFHEEQRILREEVI